LAGILVVLQAILFLSVIVAIVLVIRKDLLRDRNDKAKDARIAMANRQAAIAYRQAAEASQKAAEANERAKFLERENLNLQVRLEQERLIRERIDQGIAPRTLSPAQIELIALKLRPFAGQSVRIFPQSGHQEIESFTKQIEVALRRAGWKPETRPAVEVGDVFMTGVELIAADPIPAAAEAMLSAFRLAEIEVSHRANNASVSVISVSVGKKR
jgi:hypothetical protein